MAKERRNLLLVALVAVALTAGIAWLIFSSREPPEPVYQGKRLSEWLLPMMGEELDANARQAVMQMGTNAIPTLLRMLRAHDSNLKLRLIELAQKQHVIKIEFVDAGRWNWRAMQAFDCLGTNAIGAVPALVQIYKENISDMSIMSASSTLGGIGYEARNTMLVPSLLLTAGSTNASSMARADAALTLGLLQADTKESLAVLIKCLRDSELIVRIETTEGLPYLGSAARAAVPALLELLKDPDATVRHNAEGCLRLIDEKAAAKAGIK